ncbi:MAG TPA: hypothetical protein VF283_14880 [Bryobacteraceae bacterium]
MKTKLLALFLLAGSSMFAGVFVGVRVGPPARGYYVAAPPPPPLVSYVPRRPAPGYVWVGGYWLPAGHHWRWHRGYWARRPFARAYWVAPRYYEHHYYAGHWRHDRGHRDHHRR